MSYKKLTIEIIDSIINIVGDQYVIQNKEEIEHFAHDETEDLSFFPEVVVKPRTLI